MISNALQKMQGPLAAVDQSRRLAHGRWPSPWTELLRHRWVDTSTLALVLFGEQPTGVYVG